MKKKFCVVLALFSAFWSSADDFQIISFTADGTLLVSNAFVNGVVTVEKATNINGPWLPEKNVFSTDIVAQVNLQLSGQMAFYRPLAVDLSGQDGFTNFVQSYGDLSTIAGIGGSICTPCNNWKPSYEGGQATNAQLSHPHIAMADRAGNIFIADKEAHAIRKILPDGRIFTVAGMNVAGNGETNPAPAIFVGLNNPNGLWVRDDGTFYILDRDNGYIRKVDTNGIATALVDNHGPIAEGRGLWVSPDESLVYYAAGYQLKSWDATNGITIISSSFSQLGNIAVDPTGVLVASDRTGNKVFRMESDGTRTTIAGNGGFAGGGDGALAIETGLNQPRAIWFLQSGAYFVGTDNGSQLWYVDTDGYIHLLLNGTGSSTSHSGDGAWFYDDPTAAKVSKIRQITMDYDGNLIITENDAGFVRKVRFLRHETN